MPNDSTVSTPKQQRVKLRKYLPERPCAKCRALFMPRADNYNSGHGIYCSRSCANSINRKKCTIIGQYGHRVIDRYVKIRMPEHPKAGRNKYVYEHIVIMEKMIGRALLQGEQVHHINGDKCDNRPENLALTTISEHIKIHRDETFERHRLANLRRSYEQRPRQSILET